MTNASAWPPERAGSTWASPRRHAVIGVLCAGIMLAGSLRATAADRSETLNRYVDVAAAAFFAEGHCPGLQASAGQITTLRLATRIGPGEEETVAERLRTRAAAIRRSFAENGRTAWCDEIYDLFGPAGTMARGVVVRSR